MNKGQQILFSALEDYYGVTEVSGPESNQTILDIIQWAIPQADDDSRFSWCAISLSHLINKYCGPFKPIQVARHFLNIGTEVTKPQIGDIVIYWRESKSSWKGHVGIVVRVEGKKIWTFGGNQENQWNIRAYSDYRLLGYRRL